MASGRLRLRNDPPACEFCPGAIDGGNSAGRRGWQWVMVTAVVTVFVQGLSRSGAAAIELLGSAFGGIAWSDRFSAYNQLPTEQRQLCWLLLGERGRLTSAACRRKVIELIGEANAAGARLVSACGEIGGIGLRTLKRWRKAFLGDGNGEDRRKGSPRDVAHRLRE